MPVTCLQNVAIARKQNLAGVVNENNTGKTWAASDESQSTSRQKSTGGVRYGRGKVADRRRLGDE